METSFRKYLDIIKINRVYKVKEGGNKRNIWEMF